MGGKFCMWYIITWILLQSFFKMLSKVPNAIDVQSKNPHSPLTSIKSWFGSFCIHHSPPPPFYVGIWKRPSFFCDWDRNVLLDLQCWTIFFRMSHKKRRGQGSVASSNFLRVCFHFVSGVLAWMLHLVSPIGLCTGFSFRVKEAFAWRWPSKQKKLPKSFAKQEMQEVLPVEKQSMAHPGFI